MKKQLMYNHRITKAQDGLIKNTAMDKTHHGINTYKPLYKNITSTMTQSTTSAKIK